MVTESRGLSQTEVERLSALCKALGHPVRVQILNHLISKGVCISGDLSDLLPLAPSTVSEHLRILKVAELVKGTIDGPRRNYCVDEKTLHDFKLNIAKL
ncbi:MAG: ArsR family transcriptional regulator [Proteobacteria bacterium]|nr:MAG: ArsR family transcriptional regulator [Pseudomonadota bacterium]